MRMTKTLRKKHQSRHHRCHQCHHPFHHCQYDHHFHHPCNPCQYQHQSTPNMQTMLAELNPRVRRKLLVLDCRVSHGIKVFNISSYIWWTVPWWYLIYPRHYKMLVLDLWVRLGIKVRLNILGNCWQYDGGWRVGWIVIGSCNSCIGGCLI